MFTNTYVPLVGGATISIQRTAECLREREHDVLIVAPDYDDAPQDEDNVIRVTSLKNFNHTRFSVPLPLLHDLDEQLDAFGPQVIHAHHPFLLGDSALRQAARLNVPCAVTHHTHDLLYRQYVPDFAPWLGDYVHELAAGHANLCDAVVAPTASIREELREAGVRSPIHVIPTGLDGEAYAHGDGQAFRERHGLPGNVPVIGHVSRIAPEKNQVFLMKAIARALEKRPDTYALIVGDGEDFERVKTEAQRATTAERFVFAGVQKGQDLVDAYHAMDVFAFSSLSETQGMVLAEALAAGVPLAAIKARGSRDIIEDGINGRLVPQEDAEKLADAIAWCLDHKAALLKGIPDTLAPYLLENTVSKNETLYFRLIESGKGNFALENSTWDKASRIIQEEWAIWKNRVSAIGDALIPDTRPPSERARR